MSEAAAVPTARPPSRLREFAARMAALAGWRRYGAAFAVGAVSCLALPPAYAAPLLWLAFPMLLWLLEGSRSGRQAFLTGWWFAFGQLLFGLYWVSAALFVDIASWWWLLPFAAAALPAGLALFAGLATWALWRLRLGGLARILAFAALWTAAEWLRGNLLTGFPWHLVGYAWVAWEPVIQATSVVGIYGLSLLTVAAASLPALLGEPGMPPRRAAAATMAGVAAFALIGAAGAWRLSQGLPESAVVDGVRLRLVQPHVDQFEKWHPEQRLAHFRRLLTLSAADAEGITHVIWPETATAFYVENDPNARAAIASVTPPGGYVLTGAPRTRQEPDGTRRYWNSLIAIDPSGDVAGTYDKAHLVPFGEYVPFADIVPLPSVAGGLTSWSAGPGPRTLELPGLPAFGPLICYEVIFPEEAVAPDARPQWLLNVTNDGWYGRTAGPHQHFAIARVRAVEQGLPLVRVANTGISGVVDGYGRVVAALGLGETGVLDAYLPRALPEPTPFARFGNSVLLGLLIIFAFAALLLRRGGSRRR